MVSKLDSIKKLIHLLKITMDSSILKDINITPIHAIILINLIEDNNINANDICNKFGIRRSSTTSILKLMERKKLIVREIDKNDTRIKKIIPTPLSYNIYKDIKDRILKLESDLFNNIDDKDLDIFYKVISKMTDNIKENV